MAVLLQVAAIVAVHAAPNIPSSELPGRERDRFQQSPLDRFTQPGKPAAPLWKNKCRQPPAKKPRSKKKGC